MPMGSEGVLTSLVLLGLVALSVCRTSPFDPEEEINDFQDDLSKRSFPGDASPDPLLLALRAHAHSLRQLESAILEQKRSLTSGQYSSFPSRLDDDTAYQGMQRRALYRPLGYAPAAVRLQNSYSSTARPENRERVHEPFRNG
ncbi:uncharacterized protein LOC131953796 [Physella acuta]|uniref:uncharacterized protein LOC131953796 n=1 Tax=Physella acuta TaxID=109671 RepID=UPI0027DB0B3C|nr:uncharacterized protein LOC131953796 [Physella acuta]